jgi:Spy/CpxP family protein refolding chaperone
MRLKSEKIKKEKKMKKLAAIAILFAGILLFTASVSASPQMNLLRNRAFVRPDTGRLLAVIKARHEELEITDEQLNKIEELTVKIEDLILKAKNELANIRLELRRQLRNREERDYEKIKSLISQSADLRADMLINRMKLKNDITNVLSNEQLTALKDMFKKTLLRRRLLNRRNYIQRNPNLRRPIR